MKDEHDHVTHEMNFAKQSEIQAIISFIGKFRNSSLSKVDVLVFHHILMVCAEFGKKKAFQINQTELAQRLCMKQPNISRSINKLLDEQLLIKNANLYNVYLDQSV